jgi:hypothetical protein
VAAAVVSRAFKTSTFCRRRGDETQISSNGGLGIEHRRKTILVITPQSPLGQNLMGRKLGQRWTAKIGGSTVRYHIVSVVRSQIRQLTQRGVCRNPRRILMAREDYAAWHCKDAARRDHNPNSTSLLGFI